MNSCLYCSTAEGEGQGKIYTGKIAEGGTNFFGIFVGIGNFEKPDFESLLALGM